MDHATYLQLIKRLRAQSYRSREARLDDVKTGRQGVLDVAQLTQEELEHLLPGRKIEWLANVARFTDYPEQPIWLECEAIVSISSKRLIIDRANGTITFQDDSCSTRTVRISSVFTISVNVTTSRQLRETKRVPRHLKQKMNRKKLAV